jgi:hypothetical protein
VQVVSGGADPLPCNGFTPTQPAPAEVVSGAKVVPVSVSPHQKRPAWLPHLLALKAELPDYLPAQLANELMARYGVNTNGRTVRYVLEQYAASAPAAAPTPPVCSEEKCAPLSLHLSSGDAGRHGSPYGQEALQGNGTELKVLSVVAV